MNTVNFLKKAAIALIIAAVAFAGCTSTLAMMMTTAITGEAYIQLAGTGEAVIDWGDGSAPEMVTLSAPEPDGFLTPSHGYSHIFSDTKSHTISIKGQNITHLNCAFMELSALDVTKNTALISLDCSENQLTSVDITKNTALERLFCGDNQLTSLDVSNNTALKRLFFGNNRLTSLDVTKNIALTSLYCDMNQLTRLDVTKNTRLKELWCNDNRLTAEMLNTLFGTLHSNAGGKRIYIGSNPGSFHCDQSIATKKGWTVDSRY